MIPAMTEPTRKSRVVSINGRDVTIFELTDAQMLHLNRHGRLIDSAGVSTDAKREAMERAARIMDSIVAPEDREFITEQQEIGELTLLEMVKHAFGGDVKKAPPKVTRGRAKRTAS